MKSMYDALKHALFMEGSTAIEDFIGYDLPDESDDVTERRIEMAYEQMSDEEFKKFFVKYLPDACVCRDCECVLDPEEDIPHVINPGLDSEYTLCESCHGSRWDKEDIIMCDACGSWFDNHLIHNKGPQIWDFAPCPSCGKDVIEGTTEAEARLNTLTLLQSMADTDLKCHGHMTDRTSEAIEQAGCWLNPETNMVEDENRMTVHDYSDPTTISMNTFVATSIVENKPFDVAFACNGTTSVFSFVPIQEGMAKLIYLRKPYGPDLIDQLQMPLIGIVRSNRFWVFDTFFYYTEIIPLDKWNTYLKDHPSLAGRFHPEYNKVLHEVNSAVRAAYNDLDCHGYLTQMEKQKIIEKARQWQFSTGDDQQDCWKDMTVPSLVEPPLDGIVKVFCGTYSQETLIKAAIEHQREKMMDHKARANHFLNVIAHKAHAEDWEIAIADALTALAPKAFSVEATFELNGKTASALIRPSVILQKIRLKQFYTKNDFTKWKEANEMFRELNAIPVNLHSDNIVRITHNGHVIYLKK